MSGLEAVAERIARACERVQRKPSDIHLLPVSKGQDLTTIQSFLALPGAPARLGENYYDEMLGKHAVLGARIEWHFLGRLQSRKLIELCDIADVIHTVSRPKEVAMIGQAARSPEFFLQVNVSGETQKNGCEPAALPALLASVESAGLMPRVRGLMALPAPLEDIGESALRKEFTQLRTLCDRYLPGKSLSMGMSADFEIAIEEGADWIRLGTILFGARNYAT